MIANRWLHSTSRFEFISMKRFIKKHTETNFMCLHTPVLQAVITPKFEIASLIPLLLDQLTEQRNDEIQIS